jgi:hypothetical protein
MSKSEECFDRLSKIHETIQSDLSKREEKLAREREMAKATPVLTSPGTRELLLFSNSLIEGAVTTEISSSRNRKEEDGIGESQLF